MSIKTLDPVSSRKQMKTLLPLFKLVCLFLFLASLYTNAQGNEKTLSLSEKNAPLDKLFRSIWKQTGQQFIYTDEILKGTKKVNIEVKNATLNEVLNICFHNQPLSYSIQDNVIVVTQKKPTATSVLYRL